MAFFAVLASFGFWIAVVSLVGSGFLFGVAAHMLFLALCRYLCRRRQQRRWRNREGIFSLPSLLDDINERDNLFYW